MKANFLQKLQWKPFFERASQSLRSRGILGLSLMVSLVVVCFLFIDLINRQNAALNPNIQRALLSRDNKVLEMPQWSTSFSSCDVQESEVSNCALLSSKINITFPAVDEIPKLVKKFSKEGAIVNTAQLEQSLSEAQLSFLKNRDFVALVIPRTVQNAVRLTVGLKTWTWFGNASDAVFTMRATDLLDAGKIKIQVDFRDFPWFGPAELPIALADVDAVGEYSSLVHRQFSSFNLSRQMEIGFPLLLVAMAIVLDHSKVFAILSLYAGARAVRSFVPFTVESGATLHWVHEILAVLANAATVIFIVRFALEISNLSSATWIHSHLKRFSRRRVNISSAAGYVLCFAVFLALWNINPSLAWLKGDIIADSVGASIAIVVCVFGAILHQRGTLKSEKIGKKLLGDSGSGISQFVFYFRLALIISAFSFSFAANLGDFLSVSENTFRNALDWKHTALMPILITAALLDVGSTARKMLNFGKDMASKALLEKELQVGKEVQHRMLPSANFATVSWAWRSLYTPAQALAGDWFDIKELVFPCGKRLLCVCVADVTGHGVGSSLATSVICSHWNLWCSEITKCNAPSTQEERENLLLLAPQKIHEGLLALPQNEQCTAVLALLDPVELEISVSTCGHPGVIISNGRELGYISSAGDRLGASDTIGSPWTTKSQKIVIGSKLFFYSDGILPPGSTVSSFASGLRRRLKKEEFSVSEVLWKQFRNNRKEFKLNPEIEDDMTLLSVELFSKKEVPVVADAHVDQAG